MPLGDPMQSNRPPPYSQPPPYPTQLSPQGPQTQYGTPLGYNGGAPPGHGSQPPQGYGAQPPRQQNPYPFGPPPRATGVPTWVWIVMGVVVVGFFGLTAVVATAMAIAKANTPDSAPVAKASKGDDADDAPPTTAPTATGPARGRAGLPPVERHVPVHDPSILKGCSTGDIATIERRLDAAIKVGAPSYNAGDFEGCYSTYDSAAAKLELALTNTCTGPVTALESGRRTARAKDTPSDRAWAMRDSFDGLFDVIDRSEK